MIYNIMQFCFSLFFLLKKFNLLICSREIWIQFKENIQKFNRNRIQLFHLNQILQSKRRCIILRKIKTLTWEDYFVDIVVPFAKNLDIRITFIFKFKPWNTGTTKFYIIFYLCVRRQFFSFYILSKITLNWPIRLSHIILHKNYGISSSKYHSQKIWTYVYPQVQTLEYWQNHTFILKFKPWNTDTTKF